MVTTIDGYIRKHLAERIDDPRVLEAVLHMNGWSNRNAITLKEASTLYGVDAKTLKLAGRIDLRGLRNPALEEALEVISSSLPWAHEEVSHFLHHHYESTLSTHFSVNSLINACDVYGIDFEDRFRSIARDYHRWLIALADESRVHYAEGFIEQLVLRANRTGILHLEDFWDIFDAHVNPYDIDDFWQAIIASPQLSSTTFPYVFARLPDPTGELVKRLTRLLLMADPDPVSLDKVWTQITRGVRQPLFRTDPAGEVTDYQILAGFVEECQYFQIDRGQVRIKQSNHQTIDSALSNAEKRVVDALLDHPEGVQFDDLGLLAHRCKLDVTEVERILLSSPVILSDDSMTFRVFDSASGDGEGRIATDDMTYPAWLESPHSSLIVAEQNESMPDGHLAEFATTEILHEIDLRDYVSDSILSVLAGPLDKVDINQIESSGQKWTPIIEPETKLCVGVVSTKRLRNKLERGNQLIGIDDKKMKGLEIPVLVDRERLADAFAENICVYFNTNEPSWGVVFPRDLQK